MTKQHSVSNLGDQSERITQEKKLAYLQRPASYGEDVGQVEIIETHMSWVFLTKRHAYKLKKPVLYDQIDFKTIQARQFYCGEELRLNRRLAPGVYIGKISLTVAANGQLNLGGHGQVVDWLVKMHRLPAEKMLDRKLLAGLASNEDADRIISLLANFYIAAPRATITAKEYLEKIETDLHKSYEVLLDSSYPLSREKILGLQDVQTGALRTLRSELIKRVASGKIVEGHGDLRPEHICLQPRISIIDCLEFSQNLRSLDMADEVAFLALECERMDAPHFANTLLSFYRVKLRDELHSSLVHFYQALRATIRAKLAIRHLDEEQFHLSEKWFTRTNQYVILAGKHAGLALK